jgi:hypothetical protein
MVTHVFEIVQQGILIMPIDIEKNIKDKVSFTAYYGMDLLLKSFELQFIIDFKLDCAADLLDNHFHP